MMKIKFITILLAIALSFQIGAFTMPVEGTDPDPIEDEKQFMPWIRDIDRNGIDDLIDEKMNQGSDDNVHLYIDYDHHPTRDDRERLEHYLDISYAPKYINTLCALNVPISRIPDLVDLPGVIMVEEQLPLQTQLDISTKAIKAKDSSRYSGNNVEESYGYDGFGISVAVLDTGVDDSHPTFTDRYLGGYDATIMMEMNPEDLNGHGTHVAGIIMGQGGGDDDPDNNMTGVATRAKLIDVKVQQTTTGLGQDFIRGVEWCIDQENDNRVWDATQTEYNGIDIISVSLGDGSNDDGSSATAQSVNSAVENGIAVVCAVGNDDGQSINAPASADRAISVGAVSDANTVDRGDDVIWSGSNIGPRAADGDSDEMDELKPDVVAPGNDIDSANNNYEVGADYSSMTGTSQAAPHVTGVVALIMHAKPHLKVDEGVKNIKLIFRRASELPSGIRPSAPQVDDTWNSTYGWGMLDAYKAVRYAVTPAMVTIPKIEFQRENPNEGDLLRIQIQIREENGIDVEGGVVRAYKQSISTKNLLLETNLNGLRGSTTRSYFINDYATIGGENKIIVTVKEMDGSGDVEDETSVIANYKPIAEIYTDDRNKDQYDIVPGQVVHFHGNASYDEENHDLLFKFDMDDGTVRDYSTTSWYTHPFGNGRWNVKLYVKDEYNAVSKADVVVVTANLDPVANAGEDKVVGQGDPVSFDGTATNDGDQDHPNDDIILFEWDFNGDLDYEFEDDETGYATHTYTELGDYDVFFRVTDKWGAQSEDQIKVMVVEGKPPVAEAGEDISAVVDEVVEFHGTAFDEDGTIKKYEWNFGDGSGWSLHSSGEATHVYDSYGEYTAKFMVTDNDDNEAIDTLKVAVHRNPIAKIKSPKDDGSYDSDQDITFDATGSSDPDGSSLTYRWTSDLQGDIGNEKTFSRRLHYGRHKITLEVTDDDGGKGSTMVTIAVKDATDTPPIVSITAPANNSWHQITNKVRLTASGNDPDGDDLEYLWEIGENSYSGTSINISLAAGEHEVTVYADDGRGGIGHDTIFVNINEQPKAVIKSLDTQYEAGTVIKFDASNSFDPDGHKITNYIWHSTIDGVFYQNSSSSINRELNVGEHIITLTVRDIHGGEGTASTIVFVNNPNDYSIELSATKTSGTVTFSKPAVFAISAKNEKNDPHRVELKYENLPIGWTLTFWWQGTIIQGNLWSLDGKDGDRSEDTFEVKIEAPKDAAFGKTSNIRIIGDMGDGVKDFIDLTVVVGVYNAVSLSINSNSVLVNEAGDSTVLELTVKNRGNADDTFKLGTDAPQGWKVSYDTGDSIDIKKGGEQLVKVKVGSPSGGKKGENIDLDIYAVSTGDANANYSVVTHFHISAEKDDSAPGFEFGMLVAALMIPIVFSRKKR